jgi:hypothetical protein
LNLPEGLTVDEIEEHRERAKEALTAAYIRYEAGRAIYEKGGK